ncbi:MAG TPA: CaiB/BaiF CoA-transferase family protein [Micromonospora sp.]
MPGPLDGLRVLELGGIGPGPHAAMILGDLGADVVRIDPPAPSAEVAEAARRNQLLRNRRSVVADLKNPADRERVLALVERADVLLEGFRPGVAERLGVGPQECHARNPRLVYGRMTGWGQDGPLAARAGHDINYLSVTGALSAIRRSGQPPTVPLNLVGDYGGGSMLLVIGVLAALWERERSGQGQVVDAAMLDGVTLLTQAIWNLRGRGAWHEEPESNVIDGGAPFYGVYECADGKYVAVGPLEREFFVELLTGLGLDPQTLPDQYDRSGWPRLREAIAAAIATRTRDEWAAVFDGRDACLTPVLEFSEAAAHPQIRARGTLVEVDGVLQAAPAPRFSRTPTALPRPPRRFGEDRESVLERGEW